MKARHTSLTLKLDNLDDVNKFTETHKLSKWMQKETENLKRPRTRKVIKLVIKYLSRRKFQNPMSSP